MVLLRHLNLPSFPDDGPLNTYGPVSDKINFENPKKGYHPDISEDLRKQCTATERSLGRLFRHWEMEKEQKHLSDSVTALSVDYRELICSIVGASGAGAFEERVCDPTKGPSGCRPS